MSWGVLRGLLHFFPVVGKEKKGKESRKRKKGKKEDEMVVGFCLVLLGY
jgi:hypothetical protein